jgi:peptidyl-prolyl cis-trans isomerase A (cyclophilin A)
MRRIAALIVPLVLWTGACSQAQQQESASGEAASAADSSVVELYTSKGVIVVELDPQRAPISTKNFLEYVRAGHYDGTIFHRVIPGFMIQGGGMTADLNEKLTRDPIPNEAKNGLKNVRGSIAMARTEDPDSATAQFYINLVDNTGLDHPSPDGHGYAVFGKVIAGLEVVDAIAAVRTATRGMYENVPAEAVTIQKAKVKGS